MIIIIMMIAIMIMIMITMIKVIYVIFISNLDDTISIFTSLSTFASTTIRFLHLLSAH